MDLIVHSERARELAETLAERMGESVSAVVELALEEKLSSVPGEVAYQTVKLTPEEKLRRINDIIAKLPPVPPGVTSDHSDLYDELGLPA